MPVLLVANVPDNAMRIIIACSLLIGALIVLVLVVWYYRKQVLGAAKSGGPVWTFEDLRELRKRGDLSESEYQALRSAMIGAYQGEAEASSPKTPISEGAMPMGIEAREAQVDEEDGPVVWKANAPPPGPGRDESDV